MSAFVNGFKRMIMSKAFKAIPFVKKCTNRSSTPAAKKLSFSQKYVYPFMKHGGIFIGTFIATRIGISYYNSRFMYYEPSDKDSHKSNNDNNIFLYDEVISEKSYNSFLMQIHDIVCEKRCAHKCHIYAKLNNNTPINLFINTRGGSAQSCYEICDIINNYKGQFTCHVIGKSTSAGTMITLSCDNIIMYQNISQISPIDPQIMIDYKMHSTLSLPYGATLFDKLLSKIHIFIVKDCITEFKSKSANYNNELFYKYFFNPNVSHNTFYQYDMIKDIGLTIEYKQSMFKHWPKYQYYKFWYAFGCV